MKIAIATNGKDISGEIADRFGRAAGFLIIDTETGGHDYLNNSANVGRGHGAGVQTTKLVAETGAKAVIGPHFGPSAYYTLEEVGIKVYRGSGSIERAIEDFKSGKLEEVTSANVPSHHGGGAPRSEGGGRRR